MSSPFSTPDLPRGWDGRCALCRGSGWVTKHRQGEPVEGASGWTHGSTVSEKCACMVVVIPAGKFWPK